MSQHNVPTRVVQPSPEEQGGEEADKNDPVTRVTNKHRNSTRKKATDLIPKDPVIDPLIQLSEKTETPYESAPRLTIGGRAYRCIRKLGGGGMGSVYLAVPEDAQQERIAVKVITVDGREDENSLDKRSGSAEQEADALSAIGELHGREQVVVGRRRHTLLAMTYHSGVRVSQLIAIHPEGMPKLQACRLVLSVARQLLHHATRHHLLHNDIKESNILWTTGEPAIVDWGGSEFIRNEDIDAPHRIKQLTVNAASPEQLVSALSSMKSQVFCLGLMLLRMLGGSERDPYDVLGIDQDQDGAEGILKAVTRAHPNAVEKGSGIFGRLNTTPLTGHRYGYLDEVTTWPGRTEEAGKILHRSYQRVLARHPQDRMGMEEFIGTLEEVVKMLEQK